MAIAARRAVLLDRDGTLMIDHGFVGRVEDVDLLPGVGSALRAIVAAGFLPVVVTNQSGVARGYFSLDAVHAVNARLRGLLSREGIDIEHFYICPHGPDDACTCRKPGAGLALAAARDLDLDLRSSLCIGDRERDIWMGEAVGAFTALLASDFAVSRARLVAPSWARLVQEIGVGP